MVRVTPHRTAEAAVGEAYEDGGGLPARGAPVERPAAFHSEREGAHRLLDARRAVRPPGHRNVHVVELQALEAPAQPYV